MPTLSPDIQPGSVDLADTPRVSLFQPWAPVSMPTADQQVTEMPTLSPAIQPGSVDLADAPRVSLFQPWAPVSLPTAAVYIDQQVMARQPSISSNAPFFIQSCGCHLPFASRQSSSIREHGAVNFEAEDRECFVIEDSPEETDSRNHISCLVKTMEKLQTTCRKPGRLCIIKK
ncbi:hypothetical protein ElyMa_006816900 [Elysia marginata]|uniref:Uncharacterized protein n=1 Tax=Elysia marginata TaxID=1093978 RepID=A0AAV4J4G4_9GAST|nr:hypothetical protein ElyMa_006816900 [Elysia marginata]